MTAARAAFLKREQNKAVASLQQALTLKPDSTAARINLALVYVVTDVTNPRYEEIAAAIPLVDDLLKHDPKNTTLLYLAGLARNLAEQKAEGLPFLKQVAERDPRNSIVRFQCGSSYFAQRDYEHARREFEAATQIDPSFATAFDMLARCVARLEGLDSPAAAEATQRFNWLKGLQEKHHLPNPNQVHCRYTRFIDPPLAVQPSGATPSIRLTDATADFGLAANGDSTRWSAPIAVIPSDANEPHRLALRNSDMQIQLLRFDGTRFIAHGDAISPANDATAALVGDLAAGGQMREESSPSHDLLLFGGPQSFPVIRTIGSNHAESWQAIEESLPPNTELRRAVWVDAEHDGDLDILGADRDGSPRLFQNLGDGTYLDATTDLKNAVDGPVNGLAAFDLDRDDRVDLVFWGPNAPTTVLLGQGLGTFNGEPGAKLLLPQAQCALLDDFNNDCKPDLLLIRSESIDLVTPMNNTHSETKAKLAGVLAATAIDIDNDGWLDLALLVAERNGATTDLHIWRNAGEAGFVPLADAESTGVSPTDQGEITLLAADLDNDGDSDLLCGWNNGVRLLRNDGGSMCGRLLRIALQGTRTSFSGIGALVNLTAPDYRATRCMTQLPLEIGIGKLDSLSVVDVVWPNGVTDARDRVPANQTVTLLETITTTGSCPHLYAWDGSGMRFVTDLLGNAPLGLPLHRKLILPADTEELVHIGSQGDFPPDGANYRISITDELREILYLDAAHLVAVDHPAGTLVASNDQVRPPPFAPAAIHTFAKPAAPVRALDSEQRDITAALSANDGQMAGTMRFRQPQLWSLTEPYSMTLEFDDFATREHPCLVLTGWIQWGGASVNIGASQNPTMPNPSVMLEYQSDSNLWHAVDGVFGPPAGKTKTIFYDLGTLRGESVRAIRISHALELFWDRIVLADMLPSDVSTITHVDPISAELMRHGYSRTMSRSQRDHPLAPDYNDTIDVPPWHITPSGMFTRYGDVRELLTSPDDQYVILAGGDELSMRFDRDAFGACQNGMTRDFFIYVDGWDKDADHNVTAGATVQPLPYHAQAADRYGIDPGQAPAEWMFRYNTRRVTPLTKYWHDTRELPSTAADARSNAASNGRD